MTTPITNKCTKPCSICVKYDLEEINRIKRVWKQRADQRPHNAFFQLHANNFIAHAVGTNGARVLQEGALMSSEERLRKGLPVEHEAMFCGMRQIDQLPPFQDIFQKIPRSKFKKLSDFYSSFRAHKNLGRFAHFPDERKAKEDLARELEKELDLYFPRKPTRTSSFLRIIVDEAWREPDQDETLDTVMSRRPGPCKTTWYDHRQKEIGVEDIGIRPEIRFARNQIDFRYGRMAILIGHPSDLKITSVISYRNEVWTLTPFENGGKFFSIDLARQKNLLIVGPKEQLAPFTDRYKGRIAYIEDLRPSQKKILGQR